MRFLAIEHRLPSQVVTNGEVVDRVAAASSRHLSAGELEKIKELMLMCFASTGTTVRYHRAPGEYPAEMAAAAGRDALAAAGVDPLDVDLVLYAGIGRGVVEPASATTYQDMLGLRRATGFDVLDACTSWIRALHVAETFLRDGAYRTILIINAEFVRDEAYRYEIRSLEEFAHWHPSMTMGEAATATILSASPKHDGAEEHGFEASFRTWGEKRALCFVPLRDVEGYFGKTPGLAAVEPLQFVSYGLSLMEFGTRKLIEHYKDLPQFEQFKPDLVFGHSASDGACRYVADACGIDDGVFRFDHQRFANTAAASIPLSMSDAVKTGALRDGDRVVLVAAASGVTTALAKFVYEDGGDRLEPR
jgi:3-oxoacyl-[acyl-carrier-protein] synthase III